MQIEIDFEIAKEKKKRTAIWAQRHLEIVNIAKQKR